MRFYLLFLLQPPTWVISETYRIRNLSVNSNRREKMKWVAIGGLVSADHPLFVVTRSSPARVWTCRPRGHRYRTDRRAKLGRTCGRMTGRTDGPPCRCSVDYVLDSTRTGFFVVSTDGDSQGVVGLHHSFLVRVSDTISLPIRRNQDVHTWRGCWLLKLP